MAIPTSYRYLNPRQGILKELDKFKPDQSVNTYETARILGVSKSIIQHRLKNGNFEAQKINGIYQITKENIIEFLKILDAEKKQYNTPQFVCNSTKKRQEIIENKTKIIDRLNFLKKGLIDKETAAFILDISICRIRDASNKNKLKTVKLAGVQDLKTTPEALIEFVENFIRNHKKKEKLKKIKHAERKKKCIDYNQQKYMPPEILELCSAADIKPHVLGGILKMKRENKRKNGCCYDNFGNETIAKTNPQDAYLNFFIDAFEDIFPDDEIKISNNTIKKFKNKIKFYQENPQDNFIIPEKFDAAAVKNASLEDAKLKRIGGGWGY
ncbi:hypothetical protein BEH94_03515 [Candidatus Altiarchaeales archaeon WOR_SM1_SCG]|nr:hypothetical protein BEH94_03515 [Candidatus Altiarchaeales archaeon WOR_SM1_SCG]